MIKVIVCGGRDFNNFILLTERLDFYLQNQGKVELVSGGANGADTLAIDYGAMRHIPINVYYADWDAHGKRAGYLRNEEMSRNATHCIAFWNGRSRGTSHMINLTRAAGLKVVVVSY